MAARSLMYVFVVGAVVAAAAIASPVAVHLDDLRIAITGACSALIALALFAAYDRVPAWALSVFLLCGSMLIEWSIYSANDPSSPFVLFYLWVVFYAFYFLTRAQAAMQIGFIGLAYAVVLENADVSLKTASVRWIVFTLALVVAGLLVRVMRERIDGLLASLDAASRADMLTGLFDANGFHDLLEKEVERGRRSGNRVAIALGRVDGDGRLRERMSDRLADELLAKVGHEIGATIRLNDEAGRIEDDTFAIVCPYTDDAGAVVMCERIGSLVRERCHSEAGTTTLSFGVASYPRHGAATDALIHAAGLALDEARSLGGDRAVTSFSAGNTIEDRLRGAGPSLDVISTGDGEVEDGLGVVPR